MIGWDVDLLAVDANVTMADQLSGLCPGSTETEVIDDVVETPLERDEQVLAGDALLLVRFLEVGLLSSRSPTSKIC